MKTKLRISTILQVILLLCFFLPFFPRGCGGLTKSEITAEQYRLDSLRNDSIVRINAKPCQLDSMVSDAERNPDAGHGSDSTLAQTIASKSPILAQLLLPNGNYSGIGYLVDASETYITSFGIVNTFILLLVVVFLKRRRITAMCLWLNALALVFMLLTSTPFTFSTLNRLWGYWFTASLIAILIAYDFWVYQNKYTTIPSIQ